MEPEDPHLYLASIQGMAAIMHNFSPGIIAGLASMCALLLASALISGSEVAYFSLSPSQLKDFKEKEGRSGKRTAKLRDEPERLLATILVANNFVNVAIIIISTFVTVNLFDLANHPVTAFVIQGVVVTFLLLLFGEILPKVYATRYTKRFALFMSSPLDILGRFFAPISYILINSTKLVNKRLNNKQNISMDELSDALDLTSENISEDENILRGIVKFGNIDVKEIMRSRIDVVAIEMNETYSALKDKIVQSGYSRIPVFTENFDNINGVLYIKDLLPHIDKTDGFDWQSLVRPPYFVPENKKISDLLEEFQARKIHMAIVIDEYGGSSGIVTLEDILEEIVGEISDEYDDEERLYTKINENKYIFEGKTLINDFYKIAGIENQPFEAVKGDADTLAGLILELKGEIPQKGDKLQHGPFVFVIEAVDNRRIKKIMVEYNDEKKNGGNDENNEN